MTREKAIDILKDIWCFENSSKYTEVQIRLALDIAIRALEEAPTLEESVLLKKWRDNRGINIEDFEDAMNALQEPSGDLISLETVIEWLKAKDIIKLSSQEEIARKELKQLPSVKQEPLEVEATKLQKAYNKGFEDCRQAVLDAIEDDNRNGMWSCFASDDDAQKFKTVIKDLPSVNPQEPKYCDRNICIQNEYNGIGCDECEVTKSQEPQESEDTE